MAINKLISTCVIILCTRGEMGTYLSFYHKNYISLVIIHAYNNILFNLAQHPWISNYLDSEWNLHF